MIWEYEGGRGGTYLIPCSAVQTAMVSVQSAHVYEKNVCEKMRTFIELCEGKANRARIAVLVPAATWCPFSPASPQRDDGHITANAHTNMTD